MEYHSFLLIVCCVHSIKCIHVSVSLWSIIHSYALLLKGAIESLTDKFPSPYGVSFILIEEFKHWFQDEIIGFPSPYGVTFILIIQIYFH